MAPAHARAQPICKYACGYTYLVPLYDEFVSEWQNRMNQLSLVQFITKASRTIKDPAQSFAFLNVQVERLCDAPEEQGPFVLAAMEAAHIKLVSGDFEGCKASIDQCDVILNAVTWVQPQVLEIDRSRQSETV